MKSLALFALGLACVAAGNSKGLVKSNRYHICRAIGDPHYTTFDGLYLDHRFNYRELAQAQAGGNYLMTGTCRQAPVPLKVFVQVSFATRHRITSAIGDPHYTTFDGVYLDHLFNYRELAQAQAGGNYLMTGTCRQAPVPLKVFVQVSFATRHRITSAIGDPHYTTFDGVYLDDLFNYRELAQAQAGGNYLMTGTCRQAPVPLKVIVQVSFATRHRITSAIGDPHYTTFDGVYLDHLFNYRELAQAQAGGNYLMTGTCRQAFVPLKVFVQVSFATRHRITSAIGDPHYTTFDGVYLDHLFNYRELAQAQAGGNYLMTGTGRQAPVPLKVFVQTGIYGWMTGVTLEVIKKGKKIRVQFGHGATGYPSRVEPGKRYTSEVNGRNRTEGISCRGCGITIKNLYPAYYDKYGYGNWLLTSVDDNGKTQFTLQVVQTHRLYYIYIRLSDDLFFDSVSGYCGNMNNDRSDDPTCHSSGIPYKDCWAEDQLRKSPDRNWALPFKWPTRCPKKRKAGKGKARGLTRAEKKRVGPAQKKCAQISNKSGPFKGCDDDVISEFTETCVADGTTEEGGHCGAFVALAAQCNLKPSALKGTGCEFE